MTVVEIFISVDFSSDYNLFQLKKYETDRTCAVTGETLDENVESTYVKGLYLSPRGAEILLKELQSHTQ